MSVRFYYKLVLLLLASALVIVTPSCSNPAEVTIGTPVITPMEVAPDEPVTIDVNVSSPAEKGSIEYTLDLKVNDFITNQILDNLIRENRYKAYKEIIRFNSYYLKSHAAIGSELRIKFDYRFLHGILLQEIKSIMSNP